MEEFLKNYGFIFLMLAVCLGSHLFMHGGKGHGSHDKHHSSPKNEDQSL